jgi:hypothetical protein
VVAAVNGSIDLYNKLTAERKAARSLELIDVDFVPHKQQPSNTQDLVASESYSAGITSVSWTASVYATATPSIVASS